MEGTLKRTGSNSSTGGCVIVMVGVLARLELICSGGFAMDAS